MNTKQTVAILPGIFSGRHTTRRLRRTLKHAGYTVVTNTTEADIIFAHSAGCLWLPKTKTKQTFVIVNPPYWPGKSMAQRGLSRLRTNALFWRYGIPAGRWLERNFLGVYYTILEPRRTLYIARHMAQYDLCETLDLGNPVVLVRSQVDDWLTPDLDALQQTYRNLRVVSMPGEHDDFNYHPERYVDLLQSIAD